MRLRGYSFADAEDAKRAKASVIEALGLSEDDASIAELAEDGTVLGVRLPEDVGAQAERIMTEHGAERLVDVDETWTLPRTMGGG
jgi:hypothetical protein